MGVFMRVSDLQTKDVVNQYDGKNVGRIIDIDIGENGIINYFVVEPKKMMKKFNIYNSEITIKMTEIIKIGQDVILVEFH